MVRAWEARAASLSVAPWACNCLVMPSISSFWVLSALSLGWYFFCRSAKLRWPSLVLATATWKAMTAILVGPAGPAGALGAAGVGAVCAAAPRAKPEASKVASASECLMRMGNSFRFLGRLCCAAVPARRRDQAGVSSCNLTVLYQPSNKTGGSEDEEKTRTETSAEQPRL